jgi:hypothetical protein
MTRRWLAIAVWMACSFTAGQLWSQEPAEVQVEQFRGLRRVTYLKPASVQDNPVTTTAPTRTDMKALGTIGVAHAAHVTIQLPPLPPEPKAAAPGGMDPHEAPSLSIPGLALPGDCKTRCQGILGHLSTDSSTLQARRESDSNTRDRKPESTKQDPILVQVNPTIVPAPSETPPRPSMTAEEAWFTAASRLAATLMPTLVVVGAILFLARRLKPLIRIEFVGGQPALPIGDLSAAQNPAAASTEIPQPPAPPVEETTAHTFDIGPSFEDERREREQQEHQKEDGVLLKLFEENLKLRDQLHATPRPQRDEDHEKTRRTRPIRGIL